MSAIRQFIPVALQAAAAIFSIPDSADADRLDPVAAGSIRGAIGRQLDVGAQTGEHANHGD